MENSIAGAAADKLIAAHDGDVALLYIYIRRTGCHDLERAAHDLCRTLRQVAEAEEKLRRMGLLSGAPVPAPAPAGRDLLPEQEETPQYTAEEISRRTRNDEKFHDILIEAERIMGYKLGGNDTRVLFTIYDYLALPTEVIFILLNYCAELNEAKYGGRRRLTTRFVEKEAYAWVHREILTLEQAEEYIGGQRNRRSDVGRVKAALNIHGRELTATEEKYIASWLDMGFGAEAVAIAYDRTVTQTGALKWPYMNKILLSWHEKGLHLPREIEEKDGRSRRRDRQNPGVAAVSMDELDDIFNRI